jgi:FkbM family methyltransferase
MKTFIFNSYRKIFSRAIFRRVNTALFHMSLRGLGILNWENDRISGERYLITTILPKVIESDPPLFFDVGANIGDYSSALLNRFPKAFIHAFEPHPRNYLHLTERITSSNIKAHNIAIGVSREKSILYDRADYDGSLHASLHEAVISEIHKQNTVKFEIVVETLDHFVEREGINYIDFMKIDTEGNELAVLQGASELIEKGNIGCIHFEFNEMNIISRVFFRDFRKILKNYELFRLLPNDLLPLSKNPNARELVETELFAYQNILAVPENHVRKIIPVR